ncbi:DUF805 domain-containing protein [Aureimonas leprariae]|uniref:DUF805 domain-containing protein n=1 Tax=Plantimonas leprariae TaxID=2615207 RepID=A0A7V7TXA9_9HYPH|nr:DUF805 domain-containing protein [Aureimonas leprariae]KAB0681309.1 DUF805 domain-containing protein [Aureimonas leprariae]
MPTRSTARASASRAEFWSFYVVFIGMALIVVVLDQTYFGTNRESSGIISLLFACVHILPGMAVQVRRLHDIDWSGWWILLNVVPLANVFVLAVAFLSGTSGPNRFGPEPNGRFAAMPARPARQADAWPELETAFASLHSPVSAGAELVSTRGSHIAPNVAASALQDSHRPNASRDPIADIERLAKLRDNGSITEIEFMAMKAKALATSD